jgi:hypothetical protein
VASLAASPLSLPPPPPRLLLKELPPEAIPSGWPAALLLSPLLTARRSSETLPRMAFLQGGCVRWGREVGA